MFKPETSCEFIKSDSLSDVAAVKRATGMQALCSSSELLTRTKAFMDEIEKSNWSTSEPIEPSIYLPTDEDIVTLEDLVSDKPIVLMDIGIVSLSSSESDASSNSDDDEIPADNSDEPPRKIAELREKLKNAAEVLEPFKVVKVILLLVNDCTTLKSELDGNDNEHIEVLGILISESGSFEVLQGKNCSCEKECICCWHCVDGDCKDFKKMSCKASVPAGELAFCYKEYSDKEQHISTRVRYGCSENVVIPLTKSKRTQLVLYEYINASGKKTLHAKKQIFCHDRHYCNEVADSSMSSTIFKRTLPHIATALFAYILM
ncbi:hypothetical protein TTRE_0000308201 [Trichuris trichiura]|uniref:Uncharacterized protein n=1 Tax=Trichuris trichiura TaxID=36087 RepID=A0A077Z2V6_TRITR|nr:hypothetical protein TTRE_0000308201 [Trichuris trichiura]